MEDTFTQVLRDEIGGEMRGKTVLHTVEGIERVSEGFVVAHVGDDDVALSRVWKVGGFDQERLEAGEVRALLGGEGEDGDVRGRGEAGSICLVTLVEEEEDLLVGEVGEDLRVEGAEACFILVDVAHEEDDLRLLHGAETPFDAQRFDGVVRLTDAGSVDEAEGDAVDVYSVFYHIACGAVDVAHDGFVFIEQGVEQGGFAGVCLADDGHGDAVFQRIAQAEGVDEAGDGMLYLCGERDELGAVGKLQLLVVGKVQLQLDEGGDMQQLVAQGAQLPAESAPHLAHRQAMLCLRGRSDKIGHGFCLTQIHLAVGEGAASVFAGLRQACAAVNEKPEGALEDVGRAVAGDLRGVLARVRMRGAEDRYQHFVHHFLSLYDAAEGERVCACVLQPFTCLHRAEDGGGEGDGFGAGYADDAQGSSLSSGYGADGVFVHRFFFSVLLTIIVIVIIVIVTIVTSRFVQILSSTVSISSSMVDL